MCDTKKMLWTAVAARWHVVVHIECDWAPLGPHVGAQETRNPAGGTVQPRALLIAAPNVKGSSVCLRGVPARVEVGQEYQSN